MRLQEQNDTVGTVIVVEVSEGRQRPYYIKALGREGGVYVRVAGTTRLADEYMIKELLFEGSNRYFDQALCTGLTITDEDIDALCKAMKEQAIKNAHTTEGGNSAWIQTVIQDLNRRFAAPLPEFYQRRIIFWYDEDKVNSIMPSNFSVFSQFF